MSTWRLYRNLEASLYDFLSAQAVSDNLIDLEGESVSIRLGRKNDDDWTLSTISFYVESETATRFEIGSNNRDDVQLIIFDIYAKNEADRLDFAKWLVDTINNGWRYYTYSNNSNNPNSPTKVIGGWVRVDFLTNTRVALGQAVEEFDAHRHRITVNARVSNI